MADSSHSEDLAEDKRRTLDADRFNKSLSKMRYDWKNYWRDSHLHDKKIMPNFIVGLSPFLKEYNLRLIQNLADDREVGDAYIQSRGRAWREQVFAALDKGYMEGQWDDFVNLDIVTVEYQKPTSNFSPPDQLGYTATAASWQEVYKGRSHLLLWKHISNYYRQGDSLDIYANMCAIVQSSGMGKSRAVNEFGKDHFLVPINLRTGDSGYPPPDIDVREYLISEVKVANEARGRCFVFLHGLFKQTLLELQRAKQAGLVKTKQDMIVWFHHNMSPPEHNEFRSTFFANVLKLAKQYHTAFVSKQDAEPKETKQDTEPKKKALKRSNTTGTQRTHVQRMRSNQRVTRSMAKDSSTQQYRRSPVGEDTVIDGEGTAEESSTVNEKTTVDEESAVVTESSMDGKTISDVLLRSAEDLVDILHNADTSKRKRREVEVVLAFDEAHVLCEATHYDLTSGGEPWSMFIMLRETLRRLHSVAIWSLFLSTTGRLSQFNPHHGIDPSMRIRDAQYKTVPAFTTLRYDIFAPRLKRMWDGRMRLSESWNSTEPPPKKKLRGVSREEDLTVQHITKTEFIVRYGRPLFALRYEHGGHDVKSEIIRFAMSKLVCEEPAKFNNDWKDGVPVNVAFACLSQRLCIEFNTSKFNTDEETQIAAHMRLCLKINPDNQFIVSSSGSEPLLAEAAATIMQTPRFKAAEFLKHVVSGFAINKGDRGELVALLAVTRARDLVVQKKLEEFHLDGAKSGYIEPEGEAEAPIFRAMTVMEFLSELFSLSWLQKKADLDGLFRDFQDAYIYFNHFIRPFDRSTCTLRYLMQYMTRGAAVLCASNMPGIDALFGIVYKSQTGIKLREDRMSSVSIQVKNDMQIKKHLHEKEIKQGMENILVQMLNGVDDPLPVLRIIFSFGSTPELCYSKSELALENGRSVTTHDFWCGGIGDFFLPNNGETKETWEALLSSTMKKKELFEEKRPEFKEFGEERIYICPGGSQPDPFWAWIEESNEDIEENEIKGSPDGSQSDMSRGASGKGMPRGQSRKATGGSRGAKRKAEATIDS